jgi:hypothetical protein
VLEHIWAGLRPAHAISKICAPGGIRTLDSQFRRLVL